MSFCQLATEKVNYIYSSLAQVFDRNGDGIVVRGDKFDWDPYSWGRSPHLAKPAAAKLLHHVLDKYTEIAQKSPTRVVLHKSSRYGPDELAGFREAAQSVKQFDLVSLYQSGTRFFREGTYPPLRGMLCRIEDVASYLYTSGYIANLGTYPRP